MVSFEEKDRFAIERDTMVRLHLAGRDITDRSVLQVMSELPRECFVPSKYESKAYADRPLPVGLGQTISQPYIVALMTQCLNLNRRCEVLELGTGSGYQAAILAKLAKQVYTIERYNQLSESAQAVLGRLGIDNVQYYVGDGSCGWPEPKQFDRIIITAAVPHIPQPLIEQLCEDGLIVAPVGGQYTQDLVVCKKVKGRLQSKFVCGCRFVKLIGKYAFDET
ncbi:MAG: protein-L-isoaspartate O-methyltransferase [Planctomycetota bacterium]|nr:MAG: protein-L-isoaspartate O-methyltransferase [Planctomycetota bacterium]